MKKRSVRNRHYLYSTGLGAINVTRNAAAAYELFARDRDRARKNYEERMAKTRLEFLNHVDSEVDTAIASKRDITPEELNKLHKSDEELETARRQLRQLEGLMNPNYRPLDGSLAKETGYLLGSIKDRVLSGEDPWGAFEDVQKAKANSLVLSEIEAKKKEINRIEKERANYLDLFNLSSLYEAGVRDTLYLASQLIDLMNNKADLLPAVEEKPDSAFADSVTPRSEYVNLTANPQDLYDNDSIKNLLDQFQRQVETTKYLQKVDAPAGYGLLSSKYWDDAVGSYLSRLNETQSDSFAGRIIVANERLARLLNADKYMDAASMDFYYRTKNNSGHELTAEESEAWQNAMNDMKAYKEDYDYIKDLTGGEKLDQDNITKTLGENKSINWLKGLVNDYLHIGNIVSGVNWLSLLNPNMPKELSIEPRDKLGMDYGAEWFDGNDILKDDLYGFVSLPLEQRKQMLKNFEKDTKSWIERWLRGIDVNNKEKEEVEKKYNISEYFKYMEQQASDDFFDLDSWMYKQPGLWGASNSSAFKSLTSTALNMAANLFPEGKAALAGRAAVAAVTTPMKMGASEEENYAEVAQGYKDRLKKMLEQSGRYKAFMKAGEEKTGLDDPDLILTAFTTGQWMPTDIRDLEVTQAAARGANAMFLTDMMATTFDDVVTTALELMPFGSVAKGTRTGKWIEKGFNAVRGGAGYGPGGILASAALEGLAATKWGQYVAKKGAGLVNFMKALPEKTPYLKNIVGTKSLPKRWLGEKGYARWSVIKDHTKDVLSRASVSAISEGIEEGKQYFHQKKFVEGGYDNDMYMGYLNIGRMVDDTWAMAKSAYVMAGFPFNLDLLGDKELIANIKGGMKGGFTQTGGTSVMPAAASVYRLIKWDNFLYNNAILEKAGLRDDFKKGIAYTKRAMGGGDFSQLDAAFERMRKVALSKSEDETEKKIINQLIDTQKQRALHIYNIANSDLAKDLAKKNGITDVMSTEYQEFVSSLAMMDDLANEAKYKTDQQQARVSALIAAIESPFAVEEGTGNVIDNRIKKHTNNIIAAYVQPETVNGQTVEGSQLAQLSDDRFRIITQKAIRIAALKQIKEEIALAVQQGTNYGQSKRDLKFIQAEIDREIDDVLNGYQDRSPVAKEYQQELLDNPQRWLSDISNSKEIIDATRQLYLFQTEQSYFTAMLDGFSGEYEKGKTKFTYKDFIEHLKKTEAEDFELTKEIEEDWLNNYASSAAERRQQYKDAVLKYKKQRKIEEEKRRRKNKPKDLSYLEEKTETGKTRKKKRALKDQQEKNKAKKLAEKKNKKTEETKPVVPEFSQEKPKQPAAPVQPEAPQAPLAPVAPKPAPEAPKPQPEAPKPEPKKPEQKPAPKQPEPQKPAEPQKQLSIRERMELVRQQNREKINDIEKRFYGHINSSLTVGINGNALAAATELTYLYIKGGVLAIMDVGLALLEDLGDAVRPYIKWSYAQTKEQLAAEGEDTSGMSTDAEIMQFNGDTFDKPQNPIPPATVPTGEEGDNQAAVDERVFYANQAKAYRDLERKVAEDALKIDVENRRTSQAYFIEENGELVLYKRLHSMIPPYFLKNPLELLHRQDVRNELLNALNKSVDEFEKKARQYVKEYTEEFSDYPTFRDINIDLYLDYLKKNPAEAFDVINAIAAEVSNIPADASVVAGSYVDEICRQFFKDGAVSYDFLFADGTLVSSMFDKDAFDKLIAELKNIKDIYDKLGWDLFTDPVYVYMEYFDPATNTIQRVCGETDMIAVDLLGRYHIIDFKTSKSTFDDVYNDFIKKTIKPALDNEYRIGNNDRRAQVRTARDYYTDQLTSYAILLENGLCGAQVESIELLPFTVTYNHKVVHIQTSLGLSKSKRFDGNKPIIGATNVFKTGNEKGHTRILLNRSGMLQDAITDVDAVRYMFIKQTEKIDLEYFDNFSETEKGYIDNNTKQQLKDAIQRVRDLISNIEAAESITDFIQFFERLETLVDDVNKINASMQDQVDAGIKKATEEEEAKRKRQSQRPTQNPQPEQDHEKSVQNTMFAYVQEFYNICNELNQKHITSRDQISAEILQKLDLLMSNIEGIIRTSQNPWNTDQTKQSYTLTKAWLQNIVGNAPLQAPPSVPKVSSIQEGSPEWKSKNTTWAHTVGESMGIEDSVAEDDPNLKLLSVSANPDFITNGVFELKMIPVRVGSKVSNRLHLVVTYGGHTYTPVSMSTASPDTPNSLYNQIYRMNLPKGKHAIVDSSFISRTNGEIIKGDEATLTDKQLVTDPYSIEYSANLTTFGFVKNVKDPVTNKVHMYVTLPASNGSGRRPIFDLGEYDPSNKDGDPNLEGMMAMLIEPQQDEYDALQQKPKVPIMVRGALINEDEADLIIEILKLQHVAQLEPVPSANDLNKEFCERDASGNIVGKGFTCKEVLGFFIPYSEVTDYRHPHLRVMYSPDTRRKVRVCGRIKGDPMLNNSQEMVREFDIHTDEGAAAFKKFLVENVKITLDERILTLRLNAAVDDKHPFAGAKRRSAVSILGKNKALTFGKSRLVFSVDDFVDPTNKSNSLGISALGWYVKRGLVTTNYDGLQNTLIEVSKDAKITEVDDKDMKRDHSEPQQLKESVQTNDNRILDSIDAYETPESIPEFGTGVAFKAGEDESLRRLSGDKKVNKHLRWIFGNAVPTVTILDLILASLSGNVNVVGACYADAIKLSRLAGRGSEWHEAFHRVVEILMPDKDRKALYSEYRRAHNMQNVADEKIAEMLADDFMYFMSGHPTGLRMLLHPFKAMREWVGWFRRIGSVGLFKAYAKVGWLRRFAGEQATPEAIARFNKVFKGNAPKIVGEKGFESIQTRRMYKVLRKTLVYAVFNANGTNFDGRDISKLKLDAKTIKNSDIVKWIFGYTKTPSGENKRNVPFEIAEAIAQLLDNWDKVLPDIVSDISQFATDYRVKYEEENKDAADAGSPNADIEQHIKASYQFSQFSRTTSLIKFLFARIPMSDLQRNSKGNPIITDEKTGTTARLMKLNEYGLPLLMDVHFVFNSVLNELHHVTSKAQLISELRRLAKEDAMYSFLYERFLLIQDAADKGDVRALQTFTLLFNIIKSAKNNFTIAKATNMLDGYSFNIISSDSEYSARNYKWEWSRGFANGACLALKRDDSGRIVMNNKKPEVFTKLATWLNEIKYAFSSTSDLTPNIPRIINGRIVDPKNAKDILYAKQHLIRCLNWLGIQFDIKMLDYMLTKKFGITDYYAMRQLMDIEPKMNMDGLISIVNGLCVDNKLAITEDNKVKIDDKYVDAESIFNKEKAGFVSLLSEWKYNYRHAHDQLQVLATHGNKFYVISENNTISDATQDIIEQMKGGKFDNVPGMNFGYNFIPAENSLVNPKGSIIYKTIQGVREGKLLSDLMDEVQLCTFAGFKGDQPGDQGIDYSEINQREDYIAKATILEQGGLIFPTLADKKTWMYLTGFTLKGLDNSRSQLNGIRDGLISQLRAVSELLLEYIMCEKKAIVDCIREMKGYVDENGITHPPLPEQEFVDNYHKAKAKVRKDGKEIEVPIVLGARFTSLLGAYDRNGNYHEFNRVLDEHGNILTEEDNLKIANEVFFDPQEITDEVTGIKRWETEDEVYERQIRQIELLLNEQLVDELSYLEQLGLIERNPDLSGQPSIQQYRNIGLDQLRVNSIAAQLASNDGIKDFAALNSQSPFLKQLYEAKAVAILVNDIMVKHIQSMQEVERVFSGHPSFYKFRYSSDGHLVDRTTDQHKRFGGLISTGVNNDMELGMPEDYSCAIVKDELIGSEDIKDITKLMIQGELRSAYLLYVLDANNITVNNEDDRARDLAKTADSLTLKQIKANLPKAVFDAALFAAKQKASKFAKRINVADGAAYISDEMCEKLLRMVGAFDEKVKNAFKILRSEEQQSIRDVQDAYNTVWTKVIGSYKYSAYGFRQNRNVLIPYYNKMALFPLFKCMCTGKMAQVFKAMKDQDVDMLMMESAVKIGAQGSVPINWDPNNQDPFTFNKFYQSFRNLRKQFNTDPKEKEESKVGTQMTKVALSAIMAGRMYTKPDGTTLSAQEMRDDIMRSIKDLSDIGFEEVKKEFFDDDGELNVEKFSKFLTQELKDRGASEEVLDAVSIVKDKDGKPRLKVPLAAQANLNWILSIIVSKINKKVVDINMPGSAFIQRSVLGMEGPTKVLDDTNLPPSIYNGRRLKMVNEEGSMDCVVSIDFYDDIIPRDKDGKRISFEKARLFLIDTGRISGYKSDGTWSDAKAEIVGYRIPTQAISSIHALRVVDVLPVVRDTVILPAEFTTITGSDFRILKSLNFFNCWEPLT